MSTSSRQVFAPKPQSESIALVFDFSAKLAPTDSVSTASVAATVYSGVDASPSTILSGSASVSTPQVSQKVQNGVLGTVYYLLCTATTALGYSLKLAGYLAIASDVP